jgi:hypothetical protein
MHGTFPNLVELRAGTHPDVHNHIYMDDRSMVIDNRIALGGATIDLRNVTVTMPNEQKILQQQMQPIYNLRTDSSSGGLKRPQTKRREFSPTAAREAPEHRPK